jgi:uncharacterized membrane protein
METQYTQIFMQWAFLFALIALMVVPAIKFRKIALRNDKKGWLYFLIGLLVGFLAIQCSRLLTLSMPESREEYKIALTLAFLAIAVAIDIIAIKFLRHKLPK